MAFKDKHNQFRGLLTLGIIWLVGAVGDRVWVTLDYSVPAWDQAEYLTGSLNYWQALQHPQWFSSEWWTSFWLLSSKVPPLTYIATGVIQNLFGTGPDQATLVNLLFSVILLGSVYGLGVQLFGVRVGLWAAGLCQVLPGLYRLRLDFLLDYPLTAVVTLSFWCLTVWKNNRTAAERLSGGFCSSELSKTETQRRTLAVRGFPRYRKVSVAQRRGWLWAAAFGLSLGLALLVKQTALFFLLTPVLWVGMVSICQRSWSRIFQLIGSLLLSVAVFGSWYRTNWLLILTAGKRATLDSAIAEGDPDLNTLAAWTYYWNALPHQVSWPLLLVPIVGLVLYWKRSARRELQMGISYPLTHFRWLAVFLLGAYLLSSLNINKDDRYILPYLPVLSVFLAYGLTRWVGRWGHLVRWGSVGLAVMLMLVNLFPVGNGFSNGITQALSPNAQHRAYLGPKWPHGQVIDEIIQNSYLRSTLGVLPSTPEINQHNLNYYGALEEFQVYGRQVGTTAKQISQDARSLDWFLTKTGDQGSVPDAQAAIVKSVELAPDFQSKKTWNLPDGSTTTLYHRRTPSVQVQPLEFRNQEPIKIALSQVTLPKQAPPGVPVPVTYEWSGSWEQLQSGLVLLSWGNKGAEGAGGAGGAEGAEGAGGAEGAEGWLHDHGIGMGAMHLTSSLAQESAARFQVIERMAMLPTADVSPGTYTMDAIYLNRQTGESYPIPVPPITLKIDPDAAAVPAPELDLLTQLRTIAANLPKGPEALELVFEEIARINQYDPIQDYLAQTQLALNYRLQLEPQNRDWAYTLALSTVLTRSVNDAIAALRRVTKLDSQNPYAYAYLAFVHLYDWQASAADSALRKAFALNPNLPPEIQALKGVAALMQGNLVQAWHTFRELSKKEIGDRRQETGEILSSQVSHQN